MPQHFRPAQDPSLALKHPEAVSMLTVSRPPGNAAAFQARAGLLLYVEKPRRRIFIIRKK